MKPSSKNQPLKKRKNGSQLFDEAAFKIPTNQKKRSYTFSNTLNFNQHKTTSEPIFLISIFKDVRDETVVLHRPNSIFSSGTRTIQGCLNLLDSSTDKVINSCHRLQVQFC